MDTISISHATKLIQKRVVLDDVNVELDRGGIYSFSGINGSGKSMLFKAIAGLVHLTSGSISVFGRTVGVDCSFPPDMGIVMSAALWDEYTAVENLELIASIRGVISRKGIERALRRVGLDPNDRRIYKQFSLGMKQRLELAQAIMEGPSLLLLDEPSNALDSHGLELLCCIIREEHERGATVLLAAHNTPELTELSSRQVEMYEGKLTEK